MFGKRTIVAAAFVALAAQAVAQTSTGTTTTRSKMHEEADLGSVYVRCDGSPPHRSGAEVAGRLLLIMATAGLSGPGELRDTSKRLKGAEAVTACNAALVGETDGIRRMQLMLARSIHEIEVKDFEAALTDARNAPAQVEEKVKDLGFRHSLAISALDLEAAALVRLNRPAEAEAAGIKLAAAAPYDLLAQQRAQRYIGLTGNLTPAKKDYLDRYARIAPRGLFTEADALEWAGDYTGAAAAFAASMDIMTGFANPDDPAPPLAAIQARQAVDLALAGDMQQSNEIAAKARAAVDEMVQSGKALNMTAMITEAEETLDFQSLLAKFAAGNAREARAAFTGRSRWISPTQAVLADVAGRLRKGAPQAELTGLLARDPAEIRSSGLAAKLGAISAATNADDILYSAIRPPMTIDQYKYWNDDIRDVKDSDYLVKRKPKDTYVGDFLYMKRPNGIATGEALLMHCALMAKAKGAKGFVLFPTRKRIEAAIVRFGNPGDAGLPALAVIEADTVIAAMSEEFPVKYPQTHRP